MDPVTAACEIAPQLDRIRIAISRAIGGRSGPVASDLGLGEEGLLLLAMLRNLPPARSATIEALDAAFIYQPAGFVASGLSQVRSAGLLQADAIALTDAGRAAIDRIHAVGTDVITEMWSALPAADFESLDVLSTRAMDAAVETGGAAFSLVWPKYAPAGTPVFARVAETLTPLRYHRFDAHVAAWRAAGLSVAEAQALEAGALKDAIEADTNARAAAPYAALSEDERVALVTSLASLPPH